MTKIALPLFLLLFVSAPIAGAETSVKQDMKDAAHAVRREWKKGWRATKKTAKKVGHDVADAAEKAAKKTKQKLE